MKTTRIIALTAALCCHASVVWRGAGAQLNPVPPCDMDAAQACVNAAQQSEAASGCNWYLLVPALSLCVNSAVAGCLELEQEVWVELVADYNTTLQSDGCYSPCTNQAARMSAMQTCYAYIGGSVNSLIVAIVSTPNISPQDTNCQALFALNNCLTNATNPCPALMDLTYDQINAANQSADAYAICSVTSYVPATTNAPVALLQTLSMSPGYLTSTSSSASGGGMDQGQLILIILGSIMIAATIVVIIAVIILTIRRRRAIHRRSILKDWRPNGQQVYMDDPRLIATNQGAPLVQGGQVRSGQAIFRPVNYSNNSGFLNEGATYR